MVRLAKVELVPSADVGGMLKGVGNLTKDALTFKWAQATMKDVAVNTVVVVEVCDISRAISIRKYSHKPFQIACWFFIGECIGKGSLVSIKFWLIASRFDTHHYFNNMETFDSIPP